MLPFIDIPFQYLGNVLGASAGEVKLIFTFFLSYPLAAILKRLPDNRPNGKNIFIILVSLFYLVGLFDLWGGVVVLFVDAAAAYAISYYLDGTLMPWVGFVFLMGHMSVNHIIRQRINDPHLIDITGAQMVQIMRLTAFCWNVHDGRLPDTHLADWQKEKAIKKLPPFIEYAAFVLFFPSLMAGPAFDYMDYRRWIDSTMFAVPPGTDPAKVPPTRKMRKIPRSATPALIKGAIGLFWLLVFLKLSTVYTVDLVVGQEVKQYGFLRRVWMLHMLGFTIRTKFYAVWYMAEGACVLCGIGYNGFNPKTGQADWNRLQNVDPLGVELAQNTRAYLGHWNMNTNNWLRNYVYLRVTPKGKKPGFRASMATFVTSAFWHGFEPGYYMTFVLAAFNQTIAKNARRLFRPFFMTPDGKTPTPSKRIYDFATWLVTQAGFSFTVAPFIILSYDKSIMAWSHVYYYGVVGVIISMAFFQSPAVGMFKARLNKRSRPTAQRIASTDSLKAGPLGLPDDPGQDLDELMEEVKKEVELRRTRGMSINEGLKEAVQERLKFRDQAAKEKAG